MPNDKQLAQQPPADRHRRRKGFLERFYRSERDNPAETDELSATVKLELVKFNAAADRIISDFEGLLLAQAKEQLTEFDAQSEKLMSDVAEHVKGEITKFNDTLSDFASKRIDELIEEKISAITTRTAQAMIQQYTVAQWRIKELAEEVLQPVRRELKLIDARLAKLEAAGVPTTEGGQ